MAFEQKEGTFSIFINERKTKQMQPDRRGTAKINGEVYEISGWIREDKNKKKYLAGTIKPQGERRSAAAAAAEDHNEPPF